MQALKSLFSRRQEKTAEAAPERQPVELSAESLKLVGGGLPRVGLEPVPGAELTAGVDAISDPDQLPRVG